MPTYFGQQSTGSNTGNGLTSGFWERNIDAALPFTCSGSGPQIIKEISLYCALSSGTVHIQLAIYDLSNNLIAQGSAKVTVTSGAKWQGHLTQASITPNPAYLTGGQHYKLAYSLDVTAANQVTLYYQGTASGDFKYASTDYTGGFPASLADAANADTPIFAIRCGVDPAVFGPFVFQDMPIRARTEVVGY